MSIKMSIQIQELQARVTELEKLVRGEVPKAHIDHHEKGNEFVGPLRLMHRGFGRWDVVNEHGAALNGEWMRKSDAESFIAEHAT